MMKIPALKAKIGIWDYYVTTLTFGQVRDHVSKIDKELHKSESLRDLIQRSITENYISIKEYIIKQQELFFNSLVLAVYDDYPNWIEIEFTYENFETYEMGLLEFPGKYKIFPVDGQHRVEGIKAALKENPGLENERIAAIFIGHKNSSDGMERTRRLFTTLNRYAKPVTPDDIIALDEDDAAAIVTRDLLEEFDLFSGKRVVYAKQKAIPSTNHESITSIITLYQANVELFKAYKFPTLGKVTKKKLELLLKFRPTDKDYVAFKKYCVDFWNAFKTFKIVRQFLSPYTSFTEFRNSSSGGNLIFRPIGFLPLVKAAIRIRQVTKSNYVKIFKEYDSLDFSLSQKPWSFVLWNPTDKKMIMNTPVLTERLLIYMWDKRLLNENETWNLKKGYAAHLSVEDSKKIALILNNFRENTLHG